MSSHVYLITSSNQEKGSDIIRGLKNFIAKELLKEISAIDESRREWLLNTFAKAGQ
jgi:hypothetical protein